MAKYSRLAVLNRIVDGGLIPIFYQEDGSVARQLVDACVAGGAGVIEFTNRGDGAWQQFTALLEHRRHSRLDVLLGAGSIVDAPTAALYLNSGADFIVGPTFNPSVASLCNRRKVAYIPGCATLTEIATAEAAGVELVKVFPGKVLGPDFVRAVRGPQPWTRMVVTGGVLAEEDNIKQWLDAGATVVGLGSELIRRDWIMAGDFHKITETVSLISKWISEHRSQQQ